MNRILSFFFLLAIFPAFAQNEIGLNPPFMKWSQINTPTGKIIFPRGMDSVAFRCAAIMEYEQKYNHSLIGQRKTKTIPVIIQNQSSLSAGFSTTTPWRNEFYTMPAYNMFLGPVRWMDVLTIHEYRHSQQFYMGYGGFTVPYRVLMGNVGWIFNTLLVQPLWFREGDAVATETILSNGGRGRIPEFNMEYRALRLNGYHYNYEKGQYYSFKNFVPNPYRTGYYMTMKARRDYGNDIWYKVLTDAYHKKGFFYPFSRSLQKYTGMGTKAFYNATVKELDSIWTATDKTIQETPSTLITHPGNDKYTNYNFPHYLNDSSILCLKQGFDVINTYYQIKNGKEKKVFSPGLYSDDHITTVIENNKMTWAESGFHERWTVRDYSVVKIYDFNTGKKKKLSSKSRYFSPAPSPDGKLVIVSETDLYSRNQLILLNAENGKIIRKLPNPENLFFTHLRFMNDNRTVVAVCIGNNGSGNAIVSINTETGEMKPITSFSNIPFSRPFPSGEFIFFSAGFNGINNIHAVRIDNGNLYQVTNVRFGAFEPVVSADQKKLLYSNYTADGYQVREMLLTHEKWILISSVNTDIRFHEESAREEGINISDSTFNVTYPVKNFRALSSKLFNAYGWFPIPSPPTYGAEFYTQNLMSSLRGIIGISYNTNENTPSASIRFNYAAFYPVFDLTYQYGLRMNNLQVGDSIAYSTFKEYWREHSISFGARIPFRLTQGTHRSNLSIGAYLEYYDVSTLDSANNYSEISNNNFYAYKGMFSFSRIKLKAWQQVKSRWGQTFFVEYRKAIEDKSERFTTSLELLFPGFFRTHSLNTNSRYKRESVTSVYRFTDNFLTSRGYRPLPFSEIYVVSANYEFPIFYPEIAAGPVAFIQRVRGNVFYDYSRGTTTHLEQDMNTIGSEITIDFRLIRLFQVAATFRYNVTLDSYVGRTMPFEFVVSMFELSN